MYDARAISYVMARGPKAFAISISMQAGDGVALPVALMAAVAAVVPVVVATTKQTVNMAAAMVTVTWLWWGEHGHPHAGKVQSPTKGIPLAQESCVRHRVSGYNKAPVIWNKRCRQQQSTVQ